MIETIHDFKSFNIQPPKQIFIGTKVTQDDILNQEIVVHDFKIEDSKQKEGTKCLHLQIGLGDRKHVFFTGSMVMMDLIKQVQKHQFPFKTKIIKEHKALKFT